MSKIKSHEILSEVCIMYEDNEVNYFQEEFELYGFSDEEIEEIWDSYND